MVPGTRSGPAVTAGVPDLPDLTPERSPCLPHLPVLAAWADSWAVRYRLRMNGVWLDLCLAPLILHCL